MTDILDFITSGQELLDKARGVLDRYTNPISRRNLSAEAIGDSAAVRYVRNNFDVVKEIEVPRRGFHGAPVLDRLFVLGDGSVLIVEAKSPGSQLGRTNDRVFIGSKAGSGGRVASRKQPKVVEQMSPRWLEQRLAELRNPKLAKSTPLAVRRRLADLIEQAWNKGSLRALVVRSGDGIEVFGKNVQNISNAFYERRKDLIDKAGGGPPADLPRRQPKQPQKLLTAGSGAVDPWDVPDTANPNEPHASHGSTSATSGEKAPEHLPGAKPGHQPSVASPHVGERGVPLSKAEKLGAKASKAGSKLSLGAAKAGVRLLKTGKALIRAARWGVVFAISMALPPLTVGELLFQLFLDWLFNKLSLGEGYEEGKDRKQIEWAMKEMNVEYERLLGQTYQTKFGEYLDRWDDNNFTGFAYFRLVAYLHKIRAVPMPNRTLGQLDKGLMVADMVGQQNETRHLFQIVKIESIDNPVPQDRIEEISQPSRGPKFGPFPDNTTRERTDLVSFDSTVPYITPLHILDHKLELWRAVIVYANDALSTLDRKVEPEVAKFDIAALQRTLSPEQVYKVGWFDSVLPTIRAAYGTLGKLRPAFNRTYYDPYKQQFTAQRLSPEELEALFDASQLHEEVSAILGRITRSPGDRWNFTRVPGLPR